MHYNPFDNLLQVVESGHQQPPLPIVRTKVKREVIDRIQKPGYNGDMKRKLLDILACPVCHGELQLTVIEENEDKEIVTGYLYCPKGKVRYPIKDTIPNLLPPGRHE